MQNRFERQTLSPVFLLGLTELFEALGLKGIPGGVVALPDRYQAWQMEHSNSDSGSRGPHIRYGDHRNWMWDRGNQKLRPDGWNQNTKRKGCGRSCPSWWILPWRWCQEREGEESGKGRGWEQEERRDYGEKNLRMPCGALHFGDNKRRGNRT